MFSSSTCLSAMFVAALALNSVSAQAPANDEPAGALPVADGVNPGAPSGLGGMFFSNLNATQSITGFSACLPGFPGDRDVWFVYTATATGSTIIQTCTPAGYAPGSMTDTILEVFDSGMTVRLNCDDDACDSPGNNSSCNVATVAGASYLVRVSNFVAAAVGGFYVTIIPPVNPPGGSDCASAVALSGAGDYQATLVGAAGAAASGVCASISATAADIWYQVVAPVTGFLYVNRNSSDATATDGLDALGATAIGVYNGSGGCGALANLVCSTSTTPPFAAVVAGNVYYLRFARATGVPSGVFSFSVRFILPPTNDALANAIVLPGVGSLTAQTTLGATVGGGDPVGSCGGIGADVWYSFTATTTGTLTLSTCAIEGGGATFNTVLTVFSAAFTELACNNDSCGGTQSYVEVSGLTAGTTVYVAVGGSGGASGNFSIADHEDAQPVNDEHVAAAGVLVPGGTYSGTTFGSTTTLSTLLASCTDVKNEQWIAFTAAASGEITFEIEPTGGTSSTNDVSAAAVGQLPGTMATIQLACVNDGGGGFTEKLSFQICQGSTYCVAVGTPATKVKGGFGVKVNYDFTLSTCGSNKWEGDGVPLTTRYIFTGFTLNPGTFPSGWFFGLDITIFDLVNQFSFGALPFIVAPDAAGHFVVLPAGFVPPLGITLYAVSIAIGPGGFVLDATPPVAMAL